MKKRSRAFARRGAAAPRRIPDGSAHPQLVEIEKPIYGGASLARVEGKAVFVPLTLPGEQARVRIVEEKRGYATAELEEIVVAAPERVAPGCKHFGACGGCQYQHAEYGAQVKTKQAILRETLERGGVRAPDEIVVLAAEPWAYRNRIRLAFDAEGRPGYRGRRSHAVVAIDECPIAAPILVEAAFSAAELFRLFAVPSRPAELSLFSNAAETSMLASVFTDGPARIPLTDYFDALMPRIPSLRGVELVEVHQGQSKTIARRGAESIAYRAAAFDYRVDHGAFFQVNRWLVDALVECVTEGLRGELAHHGGQAWDLFAGVGLFARKLTQRFERVIAVESAPAAIAGSHGEFARDECNRAQCDHARVSAWSDEGRAPGCDCRRSAAHGPGPGDDGAIGSSCRAGSGLCILRSGDAGTRPARASRRGLSNRAPDARRSVSADISPGDSGAVTPVMGIRARMRAGNPDSC